MVWYDFLLAFLKFNEMKTYKKRSRKQRISESRRTGPLKRNRSATMDPFLLDRCLFCNNFFSLQGLHLLQWWGFLLWLDILEMQQLVPHWLTSKRWQWNALNYNHLHPHETWTLWKSFELFWSKTYHVKVSRQTQNWYMIWHLPQHGRIACKMQASEEENCFTATLLKHMRPSLKSLRPSGSECGSCLAEPVPSVDIYKQDTSYVFVCLCARI